MSTDVTQFVNDLDAGRLGTEMSEILSVVAGSILAHQQKGQVTLTLDISRVNGTQQVRVESDMKYKHPTARGVIQESVKGSTVFFVNRKGDMSIFQEDQGYLVNREGLAEQGMPDKK